MTSMASGIIVQNVASSIRVLGLTALFVLTLMWDTAMMSSRSDRLKNEHYDQCFVKRTSAKVGFHRDITTVVILPEDLLKSDFSEKTIFIKEHIPPGLYVDLHQAKSAEDFGGPEVYSESDIDVEKPEHLSSAHDVQVFSKLAKQGPYYYSTVTLPIHLRYHKPSAESGHDQIHLEAPEIFLKVSASVGDPEGEHTRSVCDSSAGQMCTWLKLSCTFDPEGGVLEFNVPVGQIDHVTIVASVTLSVTVFSTLFLAHSIVTKKKKQNKQQ